MNLKHFGDSYDIVKKSLLQWLSAFGPWGAHPMFTHAVTEAEADEFAHFLGVALVSIAVLKVDTDRVSYLAPCRNARSIFLDPDTGVRLQRPTAARSTEYVLGNELVELARTHAQGLVLTFDQSLARGNELCQVQAKLDHFVTCGVSGFAFVSHASFLVLSTSDSLLREARAQLLAASGLPKNRIIQDAQFSIGK